VVVALSWAAALVALAAFLVAMVALVLAILNCVKVCGHGATL
jgi:hypothetical protein